jgi:hypothetical protein
MEGFGLVIGLAYAGAIVAFFVYVRNLQLVLRECGPARRSMRPGSVWLQVIPCFGAVWQFLVTRRLARSLADEWASCELPVLRPGFRRLGTVKSIVDALTLVHALGFVAIFLVFSAPQGGVAQVLTEYLAAAAILLQMASLVLWGVYWADISAYSKRLGVWTPF